MIPRPSGAKLLALAVGLVEMGIGLVFFLAPAQFAGSDYPVLKAYMPVAAPGFIACGALLLFLETGPAIPRWVASLGGRLGVAPFLLLAYNFAVTRVWTGLEMYGLLALAMLLAPPAEDDCAVPPGEDVPGVPRDLLFAVVAAAEVLIGLTALVGAPLFPPQAYPLLKEVMPAFGVLSLASGAVMGLTAAGRDRGRLSRAGLALGPLPLALLGLNFLMAHIWTGVILYGSLAILCSGGPYLAALRRVTANRVERDEADIPGLVFPFSENVLEVGTWCLVLILVNLAVFAPLTSVGPVAELAGVTLFLSVFNLGWHHLLPTLLRRSHHILIHLGVVTLVFGYLMLATDKLYPYFLSLLLIPVPMAAPLGPTAPWYIATLAALPLLVAAVRDIVTEAAGPLQAFWLVALHFLPLVTVAAASSVLAGQIKSYLRELLETNERLQEISTRDRLTGIYNHGYFQERLDEEIRRSRRTNRPVSLSMLDLDHFKLINDTYGHRVGDAVLQQVATAIQQNLRSSDVLARYGGEEFSIIFPETELLVATEIMNRILAKVRETSIVTPAGKELRPVTFSAGVAELPGTATDKEALLAEADRALYKAKSEGRNRVIPARSLAAT